MILILVCAMMHAVILMSLLPYQDLKSAWKIIFLVDGIRLLVIEDHIVWIAKMRDQFSYTFENTLIYSCHARGILICIHQYPPQCL